MWQGAVEVLGEMPVVLAQQGGYLGTEYGVEFIGADVFVAFDAFLQFVDDFEGCLNAHVGGDECFLQVVEDAVIDGGFAEYGFGKLGKEAFFGLV